jgi:hypothetical protein
LINLICFPHYAAGGLLCDILSDTFSNLGPYGRIDSLSHHVGKIGDTSTVLTEYNVTEFMAKISNMPDNVWVGTHCWPGPLDCSQFGQIINVTTTTHRSKCYRWLRVYYHYFKDSWDTMQFSDDQKLDKCRETAKNYLIAFEPVFASNVVNIEFADIVENTMEFRRIMPKHNLEKHLQRWCQINSFLYDKNLWNSDPIKIFYQAETEVCLQRHYVYH